VNSSSGAIAELKRAVHHLVNREVRQLKIALSPDESPIVRALGEERSRLVEAFRHATAVTFSWRRSTFPGDTYLHIRNNFTATIRNLSIIEGQLISVRRYLARYIPNDDANCFEALSHRGIVPIPGR
jgi:hypothetical protein